MADFSLVDLSKVLNSEVANKAYDQGLSGPVQQISGIVTDLLRGIRCFTLPLEMMVRARDRTLMDLQECQKRVPEERQVQSPPEIAGPIIERLRFLEDANPLRQIYLNLLTASIDKERQSKAHPVFPVILSQMSRDDAVILRAIKNTLRPHYVVRQPPLIPTAPSAYYQDTVQPVLVSHNFSLADSDLAFPDRFLDSIQRLGPLGLNLIVTADPVTTEDITSLDELVHISVYLSLYAKQFVETCIGDV